MRFSLFALPALFPALLAGCGAEATRDPLPALAIAGDGETPLPPKADSMAGSAHPDTGGSAARQAAPPQPGQMVEPAAEADTSHPADTSQAALPSVPRAQPRAHPATRPAPGWPVEGPQPMPGSILPARRIVAYYGNPLSTRMGILGALPPDEMLNRLDGEVAAWSAADPGTPVVPALHLVTIVAQSNPQRDGRYRLKMPDSLIEQVSSWAEKRDALLFLDVQVGLSTVQQEVPRLAEFLKRPSVHLGVDPEFSMKNGSPPGRRIGTMDAADINWIVEYLAGLVEEYGLPPKVLVVHRFTSRMVTNAHLIELDPRVQIVMHMDGFGAPRLKRDTYHSYIQSEPVQFTGFKLFYRNDTADGHPLMTPAEILELFPQPVYIQYQ